MRLLLGAKFRRSRARDAVRLEDLVAHRVGARALHCDCAVAADALQLKVEVGRGAWRGGRGSAANSAPWVAPRRERLQGCTEGAKRPKLGSAAKREGASSRGWPALPLVGKTTLAHAAVTVQALHQSVHLTQVENGLTVDAHTWMGKGGTISDLGQGLAQGR